MFIENTARKAPPEKFRVVGELIGQDGKSQIENYKDFETKEEAIYYAQDSKEKSWLYTIYDDQGKIIPYKK